MQKITLITRFDQAGAAASGQPQGSAMTVALQLEGQDFVALNGGPIFEFTEAISFVVDCETQTEINRCRDRLIEGGDKSAQQRGWPKDRYGLSWQGVPRVLGELLSGPDPATAGQVMQAMLPMGKIDLAALLRAAAGFKSLSS